MTCVSQGTSEGVKGVRVIHVIDRDVPEYVGRKLKLRRKAREEEVVVSTGLWDESGSKESQDWKSRAVWRGGVWNFVGLRPETSLNLRCSRHRLLTSASQPDVCWDTWAE
jgi:hypothetical protein